MTFALCLQVPNHIRFKRFSEIYANFIPQMLFLQSLFGYLVVCILYKWTVDWEKSPTGPPSLLNMLIQMFLAPGTVDKDTQLYPGQPLVQVVLLLIAFICVPWLLITKPYLEYKEMKKIQGQGYIGLGAEEPASHLSDDALEGEEEGNGRAVAEEMDEEHVSFGISFIAGRHAHTPCIRSNTISGRWLFIKLSIPLSSVSGASPTRRRTCVCGPCHWHMPNYPRYCGR